MSSKHFLSKLNVLAPLHLNENKRHRDLFDTRAIGLPSRYCVQILEILPVTYALSQLTSSNILLCKRHISLLLHYDCCMFGS